jgi:hypothetical protein
MVPACDHPRLAAFGCTVKKQSEGMERRSGLRDAPHTHDVLDDALTHTNLLRHAPRMGP